MVVSGESKDLCNLKSYKDIFYTRIQPNLTFPLEKNTPKIKLLDLLYLAVYVNLLD